MSQDSDQKIRRTSSEMYPLVEQWISSGLNQKDFCHLHTLSVETFHYWVQKYRRASEPEPAAVPWNYYLCVDSKLRDREE